MTTAAELNASVSHSSAHCSLVIDLRDPVLAACLAWLIPGAGHFYQRRWGKGGLFMVCILGTFFMGMWMGQGKVVYASWRHNDQRYAYFCQLGVGLPALPALVQAMRMGSDPPRAPLFGGVMAPPLMPGQLVPVEWAEQQVAAGEFDRDDFPDLADQAPPKNVGYLYSPSTQRYSSKATRTADPYSQLSSWNFKMGPFFELGTVYTLIAGLLNVLAIYDSWGGPVLIAGEPLAEASEEKKNN
ncbi:MAG TPA: DUF6677 family protein [Pirellulales bacterium]|nr:DUF6677 family protein [Pirellulales bacterium]